jgi:FAD dependent oxidoreductase
MLNTIFNLPPQQKQKIAIIGAGAMGVSTACILAKLGIANITLFEAESRPFNGKGASINNTGILHHFVYGGHAKTLELLLKQGILFRKLMPPYVFGDNCVNYLVPNHQENTAIYKQGVTFKEISDLLVKFYRQHLIKYPEDCFFGQPEDLVQIMNEEDLKRLLGERVGVDRESWLSNENGVFAGAVQIKQSVLNIGEFACHTIKLLELFSQQELLKVSYSQKVTNVAINEGGFELTINSNKSRVFDTVINVGYAKSLEIPIPSNQSKQQAEGNLVKFKIYGLYKIPPALKLKIPNIINNFSSTIMIRGQYGGVIKVGTDLLAIFSGLYYNHDELYFPVDEFQKSLPQEWFQQVEQLLGKTEEEVMTTIKNDISQWIPWVKELENIKLKKAVQVYPGRNHHTNDLEAAKRDDNPIRYMYQHDNGGKYIHQPGFKLTSIPYQACQLVLEILSIYILKGILTKEQVEQHIMIDNNSDIRLSPEMEYALGKGLPQADKYEREKIIKTWNIY